VTAHHTIAYGFAPAFGGSSSKAITGEAIAMIFGSAASDGHKLGVFGKQYLSLNGNTSVDSYDPTLGPYGGTNVGADGGVGTDGYIDMNGQADIQGDARWGAESSPYAPGSTYLDTTAKTTITGWDGRLDQNVTLPSVTAPTKYDNSGLPSAYVDNTSIPPNLIASGGAVVKIPAGTYYVNNITFTGGSSIVLTSAPVTLYVAGSVKMNGGITGGSSPSDFTINVMPPPGAVASTVEIGGGSALYAHVYAPDSDITINGTSGFGLFGWVIGNDITLKGNSAVHYDGTGLFSGTSTTGGFSVELVK
jgi:hypothetical protein